MLASALAAILVAWGDDDSGGDLNSCDWESPEGAGIDEPHELTGFPGEANVEPTYGQTNVYLGDVVLTIQLNGQGTANGEVAAAYPDLAVPSDSGLVTTADTQGSAAIAQADSDRFAG